MTIVSHKSHTHTQTMYCVFNATTAYGTDSYSGNPLGWPLEQEYGYFCDQRDKGKFSNNSFSHILLLINNLIAHTGI